MFRNKSNFILFIALFAINQIFAQTPQIDLSLRNVTLKGFINAVEQKTEYTFMLDNSIDQSQRVSVQVRQATIDVLLQKVLTDTGLTYEIVGKQILLKVRPVTGFARTPRHVTGTVVDESGEPVIGANIFEKGTTNGTVTDVEGKFSLKIPPEAVLIVSYIGYVAQEIATGNREYLTITLSENLHTLDEVVVVGFGIQKKVNLTGAVSVLDSKAFESRPVQNAVNALQGAMPGLNITTSGVAGMLDNQKGIEIRGVGTIGSGSNGTPLILIDGMEGNLNTINPQDIESISVLKDAASSSIYGSRAPFGVVLVTTKSGKENKNTINYNNSFRFNTPVNMPRLQNSWEYVNYYGDAYRNTGSGAIFYTELERKHVKDYFEGKPFDGIGEFDPLKTLIAPGEAGYRGNAGKWDYDHVFGNTDWIKEYYKEWTPAQEHNVSLSGGTSKFTYYISGNLMTQDGSLRYGTENYKRYSLYVKVSSRVTDYFKLDAFSRFTRNDYKRPAILTESLFDDILRRCRPVRAIYDPNGLRMSDNNYIDAFENGGRRVTGKDEIANQLKATLTPLKNWNIIAEFNTKINHDDNHIDSKVFYTYMPDGVTKYRSAISPAASIVQENFYKSTYINPTVYSNYNFSISDNHLYLMAGFQAESFTQKNALVQRANMITPDLPVLNLTTSTDVSQIRIEGAYGDWRTVGFFGRVNYDYRNKYLLEINARYDGTSRFRSDKRWVWTPSASAGWNIAEESFFRPLRSYIDLLKARISYGILANQNTSNWYPTYSTVGINTAGTWLVNGQKQVEATRPELVSSLLTWEKTKTTNLGVDWAALNQRLTGTFEYFVRNTIDMVGPGIELPATLGIAVPNTNNLDLKTYGMEVQIGWRDKIKDFRYGVSLNVADSRTKILRYPNPTGNLDRYIEGEFINNIYGYETVGIAKTKEEMDAHLASLPNGGQSKLGSNWDAGDIMYADTNGDGQISNGSNTINDYGDFSVIGNSTPRFRTGFNVDLAWKGIDFQMFWQGVLKRDYYFGPASLMFWGVTTNGEWFSSSLKEHLDYFRDDPEHPLGQNLDSYYPRPVMLNGKNRIKQTRYLQNAAYMRLKNLQVGYTVPKQITNKAGISNLRIFFSGENLMTLTKLRILDPEIAGIGRNDGTAYPLVATYSFGISITL
jgi:TonB-linked SusC/RagA family outer membrane protein